MEADSYIPMEGCAWMRFTAGREIADFLSSDEIMPKAWEEPRLANNSEMGMSMQLEALGVGAQNDYARLALLRAGETENKHNFSLNKIVMDFIRQGTSSMAAFERFRVGKEKNYYSILASPQKYLTQNFASLLSSKLEENNSCIKENDIAQQRAREIELTQQQGRMFELEWYKMICHEKGDTSGYYDSFKNQNYKKDRDANERRLKLGEFWDEIVKYELPSDFQSQNKWINAGTDYRKLVEPMDIAHYYRTSKGKGHYLLDGRPLRYTILEKWLKDRKKSRGSRDEKARTKRPFLTRDSCFWARVEEAFKDLKPELREKKESLQKFEDYVTKMINDHNISSDVFLKGSSFMRWWQEYKQVQSPQWKLSSPLYKIMESES